MMVVLLRLLHRHPDIDSIYFYKERNDFILSLNRFKMKKVIPLFFFFFFSINGCIVVRPPYSKVEKVFTLQPGMTKEDVSKILDIPPYDLKSLDDSSGQIVLIYKYRVTDRKTLPFLVKPKNG